MAVKKLKDLANLKHPVTIAPDTEIELRGLSLTELIMLFSKSEDALMHLIGLMAVENPKAENLSGLLLAAPTLVHEIIALASDEPTEIEAAGKLPATAQLIALFEVFKMTVPDPKKAQELLSEVTALLQSSMSKVREMTNALAQNAGNKTLSEP
jgi:hypothetical protein